MGKPRDEERISIEVNACLRAVAIAILPPRPGDARNVRALEVNGNSPALLFLEFVGKSSAHDAKKLLKVLRRIAGERRIPKLETIKRVGRSKRLYQLDGHKNARLYCFEDGDTLVICVSGFWIGKGRKETHQNAAIEEAERWMRLWFEAKPR